MVRSQTRPKHIEVETALPEKAWSPLPLAAVFNSNWFSRKAEPEPEPVVESTPILPPEPPLPAPKVIEIRTVIRPPGWMEIATLAVGVVILCLQVAHMVSP